MKDFLFVKDGWHYTQGPFSEILYIQTEDKYSSMVTQVRKYLILCPLHIIEKALPAKMFCRVHRSYIISLLHTRWFDTVTACVADKQLPIGKKYKGVLPCKVLIFGEEVKHQTMLSDFNSQRHFENTH